MPYWWDSEEHHDAADAILAALSSIEVQLRRIADELERNAKQRDGHHHDARLCAGWKDPHGIA